MCFWDWRPTHELASYNITRRTCSLADRSAAQNMQCPPPRATAFLAPETPKHGALTVWPAQNTKTQNTAGSAEPKTRNTKHGKTPHRCHSGVLCQGVGTVRGGGVWEGCRVVCVWGGCTLPAGGGPVGQETYLPTYLEMSKCLMSNALYRRA